MNTIYQWYESTIRKFCDKPAICYRRKTLSFQDVDKIYMSTKQIIIEKVLNKRSRDCKFICYYGHNRPEALLLPIVCSQLKMTYIPLSPLFSRAHADSLIQTLNAVLLEESDFQTHSQQNPQHDLIQKFERSKQTSDFLIGFFTSGTTGSPKLALIPESQVIKNLSAAISSQALDSNSRILVGLSLCHSGGLSIQALPGFLSGACLYIEESLSPDTFRRLQSVCDVCLVVPGTLQKIALSSLNSFISWNRFRLVSIGSAPFHANLVRPILDVGTTVLNIYGSSEAGPVLFCSALKLDEPPQLGSPASDLEWKINEHTGELIVRGPIAQASYQSIEGIYSSLDSNGWFHTKDLVERRDGQLFYKNRANTVFSIGGMQVAVESIEMAFEALPPVAGCLITVRRHKIFGDILTAKIELNEKNKLVTKRELLRLLRKSNRQLSAFEIPREIEFVPGIPRSAIGKKIRTPM